MGLIGKIKSGAKAYARKSGMTQSPIAGAKQVVAAYKAGKAARAAKKK